VSELPVIVIEVNISLQFIGKWVQTTDLTVWNRFQASDELKDCKQSDTC